MVNRTICKDKHVHNLSDDTSRLAFTWLVAFADREGRTYGDPALVKSMLFPRREDITVEQIELYLREWHQAGLIVWYEAKDDQWVWFPAFEKNQPGMRKEREPESVIPEYVEGETVVCANAGIVPAQCRRDVGIREWNGIEKNGIEKKVDISSSLSKDQYRDIAESVHGGQVNTVLVDDIQWLVDNAITRSEIDEAIEVTNIKKGPDMSWSKWRYALACVKNIVKDRGKAATRTTGISVGLNPTMEIV